jgi:hypothetical protein
MSEIGAPCRMEGSSRPSEGSSRPSLPVRPGSGRRWRSTSDAGGDGSASCAPCRRAAVGALCRSGSGVLCGRRKREEQRRLAC